MDARAPLKNPDQFFIGGQWVRPETNSKTSSTPGLRKYLLRSRRRRRRTSSELLLRRAKRSTRALGRA